MTRFVLPWIVLLAGLFPLVGSFVLVTPPLASPPVRILRQAASCNHSGTFPPTSIHDEKPLPANRLPRGHNWPVSRRWKMLSSCAPIARSEDPLEVQHWARWHKSAPHLVPGIREQREAMPEPHS